MKYELLFSPPLTNKIKAGKITLLPNEEIGEHKTEKREEIIIVMKGRATLEIENEKIQINEGEAKYIEEGKKHNVMNKTDEELEYIFVVSFK
jgi:quercetin dioxygenase-like cupin family protein